MKEGAFSFINKNINMRRLLLITSLVLSTLGVTWAQDTIRVQTLQWTDDVRSGFFQFPDMAGQRYEKILMRYNMRCHDAAVGSGNVGCREWDYSCNTFITDPTRMDSSLARHPSHVISGFSGTSFPFTQTPYYYYTQYQQQHTTFADTTSLSVVELGGGTAAMPWGTTPRHGRTQQLYTAEDLTAAGLTAGAISALQLNVQTTAELPFLELRLKAVNLDALDADTPVLEGFTSVYFNNTALTAGGWTLFPFYQTFTWDGTSDLLLDLSYAGQVDAADVVFTGSDTPSSSSLAVVAADAHYLGLQGGGWMDVPASALSMNQGVTIAFWSFGLADVLPASTSAFEAVDAANRRQMNVHLPWSDGSIYWDCGNDGTGYDRINKVANPADFEGRWNHWAFTKNVATGTMSIYLNGQLWHTGTGHTRPIAATRMRIGAGADGAWAYPGSLDNISIWETALTAQEIRQMMYRDAIPATHPAVGALLANYPLNEGTGLTAHDVANGHDAAIVGPNWQTYRGKNLRYEWAAAPQHFNVRWEQGVHTTTTVAVPVVDSTAVYPNTVQTYAVDASNNLVLSGQSELYPATNSYLYDEAGQVLATYPLTADGTIAISQLTYHQKRPAKFELLSMVTPYGNGLDLGQAGKTYTFDVTDFAPILKGEKFLSMEMGGENQEEMDISFWFITGIPTRDVLSVENVWPFERGWYADIQSNAVFEPRTLTLLPQASAYKLRASITGHGQNGEFVSRQHYLNLNGGAQDFRFDVWKRCGENPVYPQGGTWIFDRAGWCPGMATDVHEFWLPNDINNQVEVDYGVNGAVLTEANYLVSAQLVSYGPPNFNVDAALVDIIRPSLKVEHERFNPACNQPIIVVKNNGTTPINTLRVQYGVQGGVTEVYSWSGQLAFGQTTEIALPVDNYLFWQSNTEEPEFVVSLLAPNDLQDEYLPNNTMRSRFEPAQVFDYEETLVIQVKTNNRPAENRYQIRNAANEVVLERSGMNANTTYRDEISLPPGCYSMTFEDDGGDGLDFWYWAAVGQNVGTGTLSFRRQLTSTFFAGIQTFNPDFGGDLHYDFIIPQTVGTEDELTAAQRFSLYPNPAQTYTTLELQGFVGQTVQWQIVDMTGRTLLQGATDVSDETHLQNWEISQLPKGMYLAKIQVAGKSFVRELVKL